MPSSGEGYEEGECSSSSQEERAAQDSITESERMVKRVVRMMDGRNPPYVISQGASGMVSCIDKGLFSLQHLERIAAQARVLDGIVSLFSLENSGTRHRIALKAFYNLAKSKSNRMRLASSPGTVQGLVNLFSRTTAGETQMMSLEVFGLLSESPEINIELGSTPGIMASLQRLLEFEMPEGISSRAVYVLRLLHSVRKLNLSGRICRASIFTALKPFAGENRLARAAMAVIEYVAKYEKDEATLACHVGAVAELIEPCSSHKHTQLHHLVRRRR